MNKLIIPIIIIVIIAAGIGAYFISKRELKKMRDNGPKNWQLIWSDEFNGSVIDTSKWHVWDWAYHIKGQPDELEYYAPDDVYLENGNLRIKSEKRNYGGRQYTSGKVSTDGIFAPTYGRFEIRAKLPKGKGLHPAFWITGAKRWPPEIDIFEVLGHEPNKIYMSNHYRNILNRHVYDQGSFIGPDFSQDFHVFAVEWSPNDIKWFVDGIERYRTTNKVPREAMYIILNTAVGSAWSGPPDGTTIFPQDFIIDYVRVYQNI